MRPCALGQNTYVLGLFVDDGSVKAGGLGIESQNKLQKEQKERREGNNINVSMVSKVYTQHIHVQVHGRGPTRCNVCEWQKLRGEI